MKSRTTVIGAVLILIGLPAVLALFEAATFYARNRSNGSIVSSGEKREYLLHVPGSYDRSRPTPLVISMHGAGGWPAQQRNLSGWSRLAESQGFLVVYPSGAEGAGPRVWHESGARDVTFIAELIDTLGAAYNIDPARIYADGFSNGGGMAFALSCTLPDRIAAVGMVAAAQLLPWSGCSDPRPVPMIAFHGTADPMTPYDGGSSPIAPDPFPSIPAWTAKWARRNRCEANPAESLVAEHIARIEYTSCAGGAAVVLYRVQGGGHTWPGGKPLPEWFVGSTSNGVDATGRMWEFFREHPMGGDRERR
jgi:polyhydroxybutyrate depolymerase